MAHIDIYDESGKHIGSADRDEAHRKGQWHKTSFVIPYTCNKEVLLELRGKDKAVYPRMWAPPSEHLYRNERTVEAAQRALREVGIRAPIEHIIDLGLELRINLAITDRYTDNEMQNYFAYPWDGNIEDLNFDRREVDSVMIVPISSVGKPPYTIPLHNKDFKKIIKALKRKRVFRRENFSNNNSQSNVA